MIVQLIVICCACALGASDEALPYGDVIVNILTAYDIIRDNILSMDGDIPLLNDPRRHYAEIIHVIHNEAQHETSAFSHDYFKNYQKNINESAQYALVSPQSVVDETKQVITDTVDHIKKVIQLIEAAGELNDLAEESVEFEDQTPGPVESYGDAWNVFLAAGLVATQLNQDHKDYFAPLSQNRSTHNFVINGAEKLQKIVVWLQNLYQLMNHLKRP